MAKRPNILFILTDDQGAWAMGCAGNNEIRTPNLDRIAASGTRFTDFFCVSPVCSPARASIITGRIPSAHGVHDWLRYGNSQIEKYDGDSPDAPGKPAGEGELIEYLAGMPAYTEFLSEAGYTCALSGKWHMGDAPHPQKGHTFWEVHAKGGSNYYNAPVIRNGVVEWEPQYITDHFTDNALKFLDERDKAKPFYLGVHYTAPHSPWDRDNHPKETWDDYFENCAFESTPKGLEMQPWFEGTGLQRCAETDEKRRAALAGYFTAITEMDRNVGRILDYLDENGLRESTLVVFTGDNGMNMGHHGVWGKGNGTYPMNMYDEAVKVPMIISHPGTLPEGEVCGAMLSHYDVFPTLLDYVGIPNPEADRLPGSSFVPVLKGESDSVREEVVVFDEYGPVRMVRTREWKYVHRYPDGPNELYDLVKDPGETTNLCEGEGMEPIAFELQARLDGFFAEYADPDLDGASLPVSGKGQQWLVGSKGEGRNAFFPR